MAKSWFVITHRMCLAGFLADPSWGRSRAGRPSSCSPRRIQELAAQLFHAPSKRVAAQRFGISYRTLLLWQRQHPVLRQAFDQGKRWRPRPKPSKPKPRLRRPSPNSPGKRVSLAVWYLVTRVPPGDPLTEAHERTAAARFNLPWGEWQAAKQRFPTMMLEVEEKRRASLIGSSMAAG